MDDIRPDMGTRKQYMKNRAVMIRLQVYEVKRRERGGEAESPKIHHDMASAACNSLSSASSASSAVGWRVSTRLVLGAGA